MFDPASKGAPPSLLMRARSEADDGGSGAPGERDDEAVGRDRDRSASGSRAASRNNPLLSALSRTGGDGASGHADEPGAREAAGPGQDGQAPKTGARRSAPASRRTGGALVDPVAMAATIWRWRFAIVLCTVLGGLLGVLVALSTPHRYTATSEVLIDPREVQLVGRDLEREFLANEAALAIVDSRLSLVYSRAVLERVIEATNLDQDPEFNGAAGRRVGLMDGIALIVSLFGEETPVETSDRATRENLRRAIDIDRESRTFVVEISVEADAPRKAATLANEVTRAFIEEQGSISSDKAISANNALMGRLDELQANVEQAERRVEEFRIENDLVSAQGRLLSDDDLAAASDQLAEARAATIRARSKADEAGTITIDDAIAGSVPIDLNTPALTTFRAQHASLRQTAAQLEDQLGPRHPRLTGAQAAVDAARQDIAAELTRIVQGAQSELRRAVRTEQELAAQVARARAARSDQSEALVRLRDLQAEAEAARAVYNGALLRSRETGEIGALGTVNAAILSQAEPPLSASSVSRRTIAVAFTIAGFLFGLGLAALAGLTKAVRFDAIGIGTSASSTTTDDADQGDPDQDDPNHDGPTSKRNARQDTETMRYGHPSAPFAYPQQPATQPNGWPQPAAEGPAQQPAQPQPQPHAPVPHAAPWYPSQPMPAQHYAAPADAHWPQQGGHAAMQPGHAPHAAPQPMPAPQPPQWPPQYPQAIAPAPWPAPPAHPAPAPQQASPEPTGELAELRRSIDDIREVVEQLAARRDNVRRFG